MPIHALRFLLIWVPFRMISDGLRRLERIEATYSGGLPDHGLHELTPTLGSNNGCKLAPNIEVTRPRDNNFPIASSLSPDPPILNIIMH